jgi:hypothetical protein
VNHALTLGIVVSRFGASAKAKLSALISGAPEDQLRTPLEVLVRDLSEIGGTSSSQEWLGLGSRTSSTRHLIFSSSFPISLTAKS